MQLEFRILGWFLWREENQNPRRKTLRTRMRTNNKLNPHMAPNWNRPQAALVGGERSRHCANSCSPNEKCMTILQLIKLNKNKRYNSYLSSKISRFQCRYEATLKAKWQSRCALLFSVGGVSEPAP